MSTAFTVTGMTCEHCEQHVADALAGVDGIEDATADRKAKCAIIEGGADIDALVAAVEDAGYDMSA